MSQVQISMETPRLLLRTFQNSHIEHNLHRVRANCDQANIASTKLLERFGIRREGDVKSLWFKGDWVDELWFAILRDEWY
ncbi:GNAT family N-acetyltransferase [Nostoc sp.]|uniref:GNAT family N-acetyltransferase n=1 Tax=Nostoc sp. TaxID=1180 RepID=UPI002FFA5149